jgi:hypothetical protein
VSYHTRLQSSSSSSEGSVYPVYSFYHALLINTIRQGNSYKNIWRLRSSGAELSAMLRKGIGEWRYKCTYSWRRYEMALGGVASWPRSLDPGRRACGSRCILDHIGPRVDGDLWKRVLDRTGTVKSIQEGPLKSQVRDK